MTKTKPQDPGTSWKTLDAVGIRVIVREVAKEATTSGGILLPDVAQEQPPEGVVLGIGAEARDKIAGEFTLGSHVVFLPHAGARVTTKGDVVKVLRWDDVIAVRRE
jgi:chaperonin GroES